MRLALDSGAEWAGMRLTGRAKSVISARKPQLGVLAIACG
jgi:hypothetical protein